MTLESRINQNRYIGNGVTTQFPFTFKVWELDQVVVYAGDGDGRNEQDVSTQCTVNITASGGTVTFASAPSPGTRIVIRRNMPYVQEDDYRNGSRFDSEEIEDRFDQDCAERQDLRLDIGRAIKVPLTSDKTPEEFNNEFWDAFDETQARYDAILIMYNTFMSEIDHQVQRAENIPAIVGEDTGNSCMEMNWVLSSDVPAGTDIYIHPLWYVVGRHHIQVSVNGVRQFRKKQYNEKGADDSHSNFITTLVDLKAGDTINVWICHLNGKNVSSLASAAADGLMSSADKVKLDSIVVPEASSTIPKINGSAAVGTETKWARGDHVHPSDTTKVDKVSGKGLSTNDFTNALKTKLDGIAAGAQANVIETVKVNGSALTPVSKAVDVSIPITGIKVNGTAVTPVNRVVDIEVQQGSFTRTTQKLASAVSAGTAITVPSHVVNSGSLLVFHNGVLCESGANEQYVDYSSTSVKFNYNLPAGDTITAVAVSASS
jgi:hypothetical protein